MLRQQRGEVQMRQMIIGMPVIRIHYLTVFINSAVDELRYSSGASEMKRWKGKNTAYLSHAERCESDTVPVE